MRRLPARPRPGPARPCAPAAHSARARSYLDTAHLATWAKHAHICAQSSSWRLKTSSAAGAALAPNAHMRRLWEELQLPAEEREPSAEEDGAR